MISITDFVTEWNDKLVKSPHGILGQCVSISSEWAVENGWPELAGDTAYDIFQDFHDPAYTVVENLPTNSPDPGDIVFFGLQYGEGDGHTGVCVTASRTSMNLFEQNDPDGSPAHIKTYTYFNCIGWFHPKGGSDMATPADIDLAFKVGLNRPATPDELANPDYLGSTTLLLQTIFNNNVDFRTKAANFDALQAQANSSAKTVADLTTQLKECQQGVPQPTPQPPQGSTPTPLPSPTLHPAWLASLLKSLGLYR